MATSLSFNIEDFRTYAKEYQQEAEDLKKVAQDLNTQLTLLKDSGWTTSAGKEFQKMAETNWETEVKKYANMLDTLKEILLEAATEYESLTVDYIEKITVK